MPLCLVLERPLLNEEIKHAVFFFFAKWLKPQGQMVSRFSFSSTVGRCSKLISSVCLKNFIIMAGCARVELLLFQNQRRKVCEI